MKEGMDVFVRHIKQKQLPDAVFPDGVRPGPAKPKPQPATAQVDAAAEIKVAPVEPAIEDAEKRKLAEVQSDGMVYEGSTTEA
eukprot:scaffold648592_cov42-Prasinocladus_malaysianus.AAC.1